MYMYVVIVIIIALMILFRRIVISSLDCTAITGNPDQDKTYCAEHGSMSPQYRNWKNSSQLLSWLSRHQLTFPPSACPSPAPQAAPPWGCWASSRLHWRRGRRWRSWRRAAAAAPGPSPLSQRRSSAPPPPSRSSGRGSCRSLSRAPEERRRRTLQAENCYREEFFWQITIRNRILFDPSNKIKVVFFKTSVLNIEGLHRKEKSQVMFISLRIPMNCEGEC